MSGNRRGQNYLRRSGKGGGNALTLRQDYDTPLLAQMAQPDLSLMTPTEITSKDMTFAFNRFAAITTQSAHLHVDINEGIIDLNMPSHTFSGDYDYKVDNKGNFHVKGSSKSVSLARVFGFLKSPTPDAVRVFESVGSNDLSIAAPTSLNRESSRKSENADDQLMMSANSPPYSPRLPPGHSRGVAPSAISSNVARNRSRGVRPDGVRVAGIEREYDSDWASYWEDSEDEEVVAPPIAPARYHRVGGRGVPMSPPARPAQLRQQNGVNINPISSLVEPHTTVLA